MDTEEREILIKNLCARLPYRVKVHFDGDANIPRELTSYDSYGSEVVFCAESFTGLTPEQIKPYLRQMSSMTEQEKREYDKFLFDNLEAEDVIGYEDYKYGIDVIMRYRSWEVVEWLNKHHFDYLGLIDVYGLALEAPANMYNIK